MNPDDAVDITIRNHRYSRWPALAGCVAVLVASGGICVIVRLPTSWVLGLAITFAVAVLIGSIVFNVIVRLPIWSLKLGDVLHPRPHSPPYRPEEILRIAFAPDPDEDYVEVELPIPLCEVRVYLRPRRDLRIIASVADGIRLRKWAKTKGIEVVETGDALMGSSRRRSVEGGDSSG